MTLPIRMLRASSTVALTATLLACDEPAADRAAGDAADDAQAQADSGVDANERDADEETSADASASDAHDFGPYTPPTYPALEGHPEPPAVLRDVALINDDAEFTRPFVPGHRTSMDGRVALRVQGGPPGGEQLARHLSFWLLVPERLDAPVMAGPPGAEILGETEPFDVPFPPAFDERVSRLGHHAICDPTEPFGRPGERPNPYACGPEQRHDCYDLVIISTTSPGIGARLWGTPVTVEVEQPKTADARILDVRMGEPVAGIEIPQTTEFTEPAVTRDGRLLTGRLGRAPREWIHPGTGEVFVRPYDLAYSVLPDDASPCDVRGWTSFHPMSYAPEDPQMVGRYGLAAWPFRDSEGNVIRAGEDVGGTYPWVDREGANVFMAGVQGRLQEQSEELYPRRCVVDGCERFSENNDWDRGFLVAGLWTHGKFVHLDAMINNIDWAVGVTPETHWWVDLYRHAGAPVPVRFGSGRFIEDFRGRGPYPAGYTHNANILDSLQNTANHHRAVMPITPRDVVWIMSTGVATDEVVFDDFMDPNALIVSNMQASITQHFTEAGESVSVPRYWNGQVRNLLVPISAANFHVLDPDGSEEIHIQNAATSPGWRVPAYGFVPAGAARIEPVALGGMYGKGFWSTGETGIRYDIPAQDRDILAHDWYFGVFVDPRDDLPRVLASFPDGSEIHIEGRNLLRFVRQGSVVFEGALRGRSEGWFHLGLALSEGNRSVTVLVDGYAMHTFATDEPIFVLSEGAFVLAGPSGDWRGVRGWLDELRVLAHVPNVEVLCNHAGGTLVTAPTGTDVAALAAAYPSWAHERVARAAGGGTGTFACHTNYNTDYGAHLRNLPAGTESLRERINFPEGPLRAGAPRPDSSSNAFCLGCHHEEGRGGLGLAALAFRPDVLAENDRRRQPMQPPRRVFGNIPAGWIPPGPGPGGPAEALVAPPEGLIIDQWLLPAD